MKNIETICNHPADFFFRRTVKSCAAIACSGKRVGAYPYAGGIENRGAQAESGF